MATQILIVDDEPMILTLMEHAFQNRPAWNVTCVDSAEKALEVQEPGKFDLIVVDKNLGAGMNGVELVEQIRDTDRIVGICMITGYGSIENALEMLHLRVDGYLEKPFDDIREVGERFARIIRKSGRRRSGEISEVHEVVPIDETSDADKDQRVLLVSREEGEIVWIESVLKDVSAVDKTDSYAAVLDVLAKNPPALIILDTRLQPGDVEKSITSILDAAPDLDLVVMAPSLSMSAIKRFIDLGIWAILDLPLVKDQFDIRVVQTLAYTA